MVGVLIGFAIIASIIAAGYVVGRIRLLGPHAPLVLARLAYFVLAPCLLFTILSTTPVEQLFSAELAIAALASFIAISTFALIAKLAWRRKTPETIIGSLSSGYVNANNIGIPVSVYVLGDAAASAPIILLQLLVIAPIGLALLDMTTKGRGSLLSTITQPLRNPILIGSALGVIVSISGVTLPDPVMEPFLIVGAAAVPLMLLNYGISLHGQRILQPKSGRKDVLLASAIKLALMPLVAWVIARFAFGLDGHELFVAVGLAALPTAQNVFNYAQLHARGTIVARDTIFITTLGSLPVLLLVAALLS
jgi:malonate transporter